MEKQFEVLTIGETIYAYTVPATSADEAQLKLTAFLDGDSEEEFEWRVKDHGDEYLTGDADEITN